jgi:hypothetical protein
MPLPDSDLRALHTAYCDATGFALTLTSQRLFAWEPWLVAKLTPRDVRDLVAHHRRQARENRPARSLLFRTLIAGPGAVESAEEDLALLRAQRRVPVVDAGRAAVLRATGRPEPRQAAADASAARPAGEVAADALAAFLALRDTSAAPPSGPGQNDHCTKQTQQFPSVLSP